MRWPFSRRGNERAAPGRGAASPAADTSASAPVQRRAGWADLPPIQRASHDIDLTAESRLFVENLVSRSPFDTTLQPLGHDVSIEAPAGIATGIARPAQHHAGTAQLQHRLRSTPKPAPARAQRAAWPSVHPASPPPAPEPTPVAVARHEAHEEEAATFPVEEVATHAAEEEVATAPAAAGETPAAAPVPAPAQRAPLEPVRPAASSPAPVARHETGAPHEDEVATSPAAEAPPRPAEEPVQRAPEAAEAEAAEPDAAEPVQRAADDEEEAATTPEDGVQRVPESPGTPAPTVGARPVVAARAFRSSLSPISKKVGLEPATPMPFAAQRAPAAAGASAPAQGVAASAPSPAAPGAAPAAPATAVGEPAVVQRAAQAASPVAPSTPAAPVPKRPTFDDAPQAPGTQQAGALESVQRSSESFGPLGAPGAASALPTGRRKVGLGAPLASPETVARGTFSPEGFPQPARPARPAPPQRVFRRTTSSLSAQRSAADAGIPLEVGAAPAEPSSPSSAPTAGAKPPLAEPQPAPSSAQRSPADTPDTPLPLAPAPGVQRHAGHEHEEAAAPTPAAPADEVQRAPEAPPQTGFDAFVAHASAVAAGRSPDESVGDEFGPVQRAAEHVDFGPTGTLAPRLDLPRRRRQAASGRAPASASEPAGVQRAPAQTPPRLTVMPLVGKRPLQVQRSSEDVPGPIRAGVEQELSRSLEGVKVHRSPESGTAARELKAKAFTTGGEIHLPADHGPLDREPARSLVAHELVHVAQQRELGASLPTEESDRGRVLEAQAQRMEAVAKSAPTTPSPPQRAPQPGPLVLARRPAAERAMSAAVEVARQAASGAYTLTATAPQLAPAQAAQPLPQPPAPVQQPGVSMIQRSATSTPGSSPSGAEEAELAGGGTASTRTPAPPALKLEEVWTFVRGKLRDELISDRERAGLTTDLF